MGTDGLIFPRLQLEVEPAEADREVLRKLQRAARLSRRDLGEARKAAAAAVDNTDAESGARPIALVAAAELAGLDGDWASLHLMLGGALDASGDAALVLEAVRQIALANGDLDNARNAAQRQVDAAARLAFDGTNPGACHESLLAPLDHLGEIAIAAADWAAAIIVYDEVLRIARVLVEQTATRDSRRNLSISLNRAGRVAEAAGERDRAGQVYEESLQTARELVAELATVESRRDLAIGMNNVGRVAEAAGEWDRAGQVYEESLQITRELVGQVPTVESRRDLSVSLNGVGRVAEAVGNVEDALKAFEESRQIRRGLAVRLGTKAAHLDREHSEASVARVQAMLGPSLKSGAT